MKNQDIVLSSTHLDLHGDLLGKEVLESGAIAINSGRKPRIGIEHDMSLPPLGRVNNARVIEGSDKEFYLVASQEFFDKKATTTLDDGTVLIKEYFSDGGSPFAEVKTNSVEDLQVSIDKNNFESLEVANNFYEELKTESTIKFRKSGHMRKAVLNDPELLITLSEIYALYFFGTKLFPKITEKISEKAATDIAGLYDLIKRAVKKIAENSIPKNRPINYIFEFPGQTNIELIIKTSQPDIVATAFTADKIKPLSEKAENMKALFNAEKIQFFFNDKQEWEFNYLLTFSGETIGTPLAFQKRDKAFQELAQKMINKKN